MPRKATKLDANLHRELRMMDGQIQENLDEAVRLLLATQGHRQKVAIPEELLQRLDTDAHTWEDHIVLALKLYLDVLDAGYDPVWALRALDFTNRIQEMDLHVKLDEGAYAKVIIV